MVLYSTRERDFSCTLNKVDLRNQSMYFFLSSFVSTCLLLFLNFSMSAQQITVTGKVYQAKNNKPVPFANVYAGHNRTIGTTADEQGSYELKVPAHTDSLVASAIGFDKTVKALSDESEQTVVFTMGEGSFSIDEVVIKPGIDPVKQVFNNMIENKPKNDLHAHSFYTVEAYNKIEIDVNNLTKKFIDRWYLKAFRFMFEGIDSTAEDPYLPFFITETLSKITYSPKPPSKSEEILASWIPGLRPIRKSLSQYLGTMYQDINIYDNWISLLEVSFVSPLNKSGMIYYEYELADSAFIEKRWSYRLSFKPKRKWQNSFIGHVWIDAETWAVTKVDMTLAGFSQINFVEGMQVQQDYDIRDDSTWILTEDNMQVDFVRIAEPFVGFKSLTKNSPGLIFNKSTSYKDYQINNPDSVDAKDVRNDQITLSDSAANESEEYWQTIRHKPLTENQYFIYETMDSLQKMPLIHTLTDVFSTVADGHYPLGVIGVGDLWSLYNFSDVEGHRVGLSLQTTEHLTDRFQLRAYGAYGFRDKDFKYGLDYNYFFNRKPLETLNIRFRDDLTSTSNIDDNFANRALFADVLLRRNDENGEEIPLKLLGLRETKIEYFKEWDIGFSIRTGYVNRKIDPKFNFQYLTNGDDFQADSAITSVETSEFTITGRFAYQEKFVSSTFDRESLGSIYPIASLQYTLGVNNFLGSDFDYHKLELSIDENMKVQPFGETYYNLTAGKVFGRVPYLLMEVPQGNDGYFVKFNSFNMMEQYEFATDRYVMLFADHHFEGFFFQKIPVIRELQFRTVATFRALWGDISDKNVAGNRPNFEGNTPEDAIVEISEPDGVPYMEAGIGVENIFKFFRVDMIWRLTHQFEDRSNFGVRFGIRVDF